MTAFEELKEICRAACHERNACKPGFEALMQAETIPQILAVWKKNWDDVYNSKYYDIMAENIVSVFNESKDLFHASQVYVNEPAEAGIVIVSSPEQPVTVSGKAQAYLFTSAQVTARGNSQVYCRHEGATVTLYDHTYGQFKNGTAYVHDFAEANGVFQECHTYNAAEVVCNGGSVVDHGHRRIAAYADSSVYSDTPRNIELGGQAKIYPLSDYRKEDEA